MSSPARDAEFMRRALALAERGWGRVAPNPLVGAVLVQDGEIVGEGWHTEYGRPHAEVEALRQAGDRARGATAYVTLEPCSHFGKTPPCVDALLDAGVARVVIACADPSPEAGGGAERLRAAGVEVVEGVVKDAARDLNAPFLHRFSPEGDARPWVELKLALSLDACVADAEGRSAWITGEPARAEVHHLRAGHDAIAVGIGTVLTDNPLLTVRGSVTPRVPPVRVVFDRRLRTPPDSRLAITTDEAPLWILCAPDAAAERRHALQERGARVISCEDLMGGLAALRSDGIGSLFCEGGAALASALLAADAVDRLTLFYAPVLFGAGGRGAFEGLPPAAISAAHRWRHLGSRAVGADTLISLAR